MNTAILLPAVQDFINEHLKTDPAVLILKGTHFDNVSITEIVEQIEAKNKCEKKLPTWFSTKGIYYPNKLNIEQTSSEVTAQFKSQLISGKLAIDITGGFGVDAYYLSNSFDEVLHCEFNTELSKISRYNYGILKKQNIKSITADGLSVLEKSTQQYDWIYVDPSRRHDSKGKVFFLKDCIPDIPRHSNLLWKRTNQVLIKTSPLLDISIGIEELDFVKTIYVVAVNNEVKELLWILEYGFNGCIEIKTHNLKSENSEAFDFLLDEETKTDVNYSKPLKYIYEPNSAIMKSGGFNSVAHKFKLKKLHKHSHLYTSDKLVDFPGRIFILEKSVPYSKKQLKNLSIPKANITTRNFPETVQNLRRFSKIKDGGEHYLFFTTDLNNYKIILICKKP